MPNLPTAFGLNYREILGSCALLYLLVGKDIFQVQTDVVHRRIE
jgi:hypothetical protein